MGIATSPRRALGLFGSLCIVVAIPPDKTPFLGVQDRVETISKLFDRERARVEVESWDRLTVDFAKERGIRTIVRGLRPTGDFDSEFQMAAMSQKFKPPGGSGLYYHESAKLLYFLIVGSRNFFSWGGCGGICPSIGSRENDED